MMLWGMTLITGKGVPKDTLEGVRLMRQAAFGSMLCAPLRHGEQVFGVICLGRAARDFGSYWAGSRRVLFDRSELDGDRARVWLTVEEYYDGGPFGGGALRESCAELLAVPSDATERVQEAHITLIHLLCELVERMLFGDLHDASVTP